MIHDTDLNHCRVSSVAEASAGTNETKLSSAAEVRSSRPLQPAAVSALWAQSNRHLQAGTTGPPADPTPADTTTQQITRLKADTNMNTNNGRQLSRWQTNDKIGQFCRRILSDDKKSANFCMSHDRFYRLILSANIIADKFTIRTWF